MGDFIPNFYIKCIVWKLEYDLPDLLVTSSRGQSSALSVDTCSMVVSLSERQQVLLHGDNLLEAGIQECLDGPPTLRRCSLRNTGFL